MDISKNIEFVHSSESIEDNVKNHEEDAILLVQLPAIHVYTD